MAQTKTKTENKCCKTPEENSKLLAIIDDLIVRVGFLEETLSRSHNKTRINRVETFNNEAEPETRNDTQLKMTYEDKLISMTNAVKILPPNMIKNGRHAKHNVEAICGFKIDDDMMDEVYDKFSHED